jgi:long-chain acyl-CoA synthetase
VPDLEMKFVDPETRETRVPSEHLDPNAPAELTGHEPDFDEESTYLGEIAIRGPNVFEGYHNRPETTGAAFDDEGWFYTEDIARVDEDRFLRMVDRADDMIIVAGRASTPPRSRTRSSSTPPSRRPPSSPRPTR